mmetsp:Transcript_6045/g.10260  ORF Transcript_6045/g.10260 Transcript_6045/m.10260 type:complete len:86 (+) Transcript_6045:325-582(+)
MKERKTSKNSDEESGNSPTSEILTPERQRELRFKRGVCQLVILDDTTSESEEESEEESVEEYKEVQEERKVEQVVIERVQPIRQI